MVSSIVVLAAIVGAIAIFASLDAESPKDHARAACEAFYHAAFGDPYVTSARREIALDRSVSEAAVASRADAQWKPLYAGLVALSDAATRALESSAKSSMAISPMDYADFPMLCAQTGLPP